LNTMSRIFSSCVALGWMVLTPVAFAGPNPAVMGPILSGLVVGQTGAQGQGPEISKRKINELLADARRAMAEQNWETADSLVSRAEGMNVKFGLFHIGDTPQKARRDLQQRRPATQQNTGAKPGASQATALPSQKFAPSAASEPAPDQGPSSAIVDPSSRIDQFQAGPPEDSRAPVSMQDPKGQAKTFLTKGRRELSQGNLIGAAHWYQKSAEMQAQFNPGEDSPDRLLEDIRQAGGKVAKPANTLPPEQALAQGPGAVGQPLSAESSPFGRPAMTVPPTGNEVGLYPQAELSAPVETDDAGIRAQSDKLLWTARRALAVGDARQANDLVQQAKSLRVRYDFHEDSCDKVAGAIQRFAALSQLPGAEKETEKFRRQYSELMMQQAEALMNWGDFDEAERLTNDAKRLPVNYGPFDAQPDTMLQRIAAARKQPQGQQVEPLPPVAAGPVQTGPSDKDRHLQMVAQARQALAAGDLQQAENLARSAENMRVPDTEFGRQDDRAWLVLLDIQKLQQQRANVGQAGGNMPIGPANGTYPNSQAMYDPRRDPTRNIPVATGGNAPNVAPPREFAQTPAPGQGGPAPIAETIPGGLQTTPMTEPIDVNMPRGLQLLTQGEAALRKGDRATATGLFREAYQYREQLDPLAQQRLQNYLQTLPPPTNANNTKRPSGDGSLLDQAAGQRQVLVRKVSADLAHQESIAAKMRENDPKGALVVLEKARIAVDKSGLDTASRDLLLRRVDRSILDMERYIAQNHSQIDLKERNTNTKEQLERERTTKVEVQEKLALLVNEFNKLMEEERFPEAELVAKKAQELAPNEVVVLQLKRQVTQTRRLYNNNRIRDLKEEGYNQAMTNSDIASIPFDDNNPYQMPDAKSWKQLTDRRKPFEGGSRRSERELEIEKKLKTPVSLKFHETPLDQVMNHLARLGGMNLYLDQRGLSEQGVTLSTPVTIDLSQDIMMKSALNLILEPLHLSYVIKDEVLKITSEELRDGVVYPMTYNVADLVIPIPNFVPSSRMGLAGALHDAHGSMGMLGSGSGGGVGGVSPIAAVASHDGSKTNAVLDPRLMAQFNNATGAGGQSMSGGYSPSAANGQPAGFGPGGMGGGVQPDFDSLIELLTSTIRPDTWSDTGGPGAIEKFPTNLSLVITQTQEVHEQIADLLAQLRRLQDLQVTIEVRFIRLDDNFYERIGVDFQFDINTFPDHQFQIFGSKVQQVITPGAAPPATLRDTNHKALQPDQSMTVGLAGPNGQFSSDLDIPFSNSSFGLALPNAFSGFPGAGVADGGINFGFALLSDLEAALFIDAAQGDSRTNLLQAPKVTLFNGQQAFVSDTSQSPFVISVVPVVGDFAAAQQPVIVVLNEGTFLSVQAVISNDRRFVRLTVVPFFSNIGAVNTFQFTGSSSTTNNTSSDGPATAIVKRSQDQTTTTEGTTVQLPTFAFFTVTTTVSVPDGGTVLLGGIKRLSENRAEFGVPILSKVPYINRLFRNVGIGRQTQSLMMMVTPRIIIQEEEELNNQGALPTN
jgi:general secretion pathway protein D